MLEILADETIEEFNSMRESGELFKILQSSGNGDMVGVDTFVSYAVMAGIPFNEAYEIVEEANTRNDFKFTMIKYELMCTYEFMSKDLDEGTLESFASDVVSQLAVEDMRDMINSYKNILVKIGKSALEPLYAFLTTEHTNKPEKKPGRLYPVKENFDAAYEVLGLIMQNASGNEAQKCQLVG